jgi:hypothetical protein
LLLLAAAAARQVVVAAAEAVVLAGIALPSLTNLLAGALLLRVLLL